MRVPQLHPRTIARTLAVIVACAAFAHGGRADVSAPRLEAVDLGGGVKMELVLIAPGRFTMGSGPDAGERDETPAHQVTISRPFYLGQYEVTQAQWNAIMDSNPSRHRGAKLPVEDVSWNDCQRFLRKLSAKTGRQFVLPTEAQWEFACRAGTTTPWYFGDRETALPDHGWVGANAQGRTHPVGMKPPNPWGLHDLYGNVWEWVADWYANPYPTGDAIDPAGPATGTARVLRGGAWGDDAWQARSAYRNSMGPDQGNPGSGFRCLMLVPVD